MLSYPKYDDLAVGQEKFFVYYDGERWIVATMSGDPLFSIPLGIKAGKGRIKAAIKQWQARQHRQEVRQLRDTLRELNERAALDLRVVGVNLAGQADTLRHSHAKLYFQHVAEMFLSDETEARSQFSHLTFA